MAHKKEPGSAWRHTTVLVRADIFEGVCAQGIDISDACNRALADIIGIDYRQQRLDDVPVPPPVIIASDGGVPATVKAAPALVKPAQPPVINADDPKAAGTITRTKKLPVRKPVPGIPAHDAPSGGGQVPEMPEKPDTIPAKTPRTPSRKKGGTGDALRRFIAARIIRDDADGAAIPKDELYRIFSRWCRDQKISPVPEAKSVTIALKNQFAFREKTDSGTPGWMNVRFR
jgi:hypothetical protein